jgi:IS5 family transposase
MALRCRERASSTSSDEQTEFLIRDRLSFMRFLDLGLEDTVPDATTLWLFREALVEAKMIDTLFDRFGQHLAAKGYRARRPDRGRDHRVGTQAAQHARGE